VRLDGETGLAGRAAWKLQLGCAKLPAEHLRMRNVELKSTNNCDSDVLIFIHSYASSHCIKDLVRLPTT